ncbi:MAG: spore maturation protein [Firmicutes bacterium]|nr:spore maturation protein [Bacillota bacterium]
MTVISSYIIPVIFLTVLIASMVKKKNAYNAFIDGSRSAIDLIVGAFPYLITIMLAVEVFRRSGAAGVVADFISPAMRIFGIPKELAELMLIRPLSGAGALGVLENIYATYGADTYIGRSASVVYGSSETVFYISTIYFSQTNIKKLGPAIPFALLSTFIGCVVGCFCLRFF